MTKPVLVLVHGRAQGGKDEAELRELWLETLRIGFGASRRSRVDELDVRFPFYGDLLDELVAHSGTPLASAVPRGAEATLDPAFADFQVSILETVRARRNIAQDQILSERGLAVAERGPLQWAWVQAMLRTLDRVPGLSGTMIERFTRDVWVYLTDEQVRRAINDTVAKCLRPQERCVVVGHSLGSVVTYDVLRSATDAKVALYATVGSPLGVGPIRRMLAPLKYPAVAAAWYNAFDERDAVALCPLDDSTFPVRPEIENYDQVKNGTDNAHGIIGYLNDPVVAGRIFDALFV